MEQCQQQQLQLQQLQQQQHQQAWLSLQEAARRVMAAATPGCSNSLLQQLVFSYLDYVV